MRRWERSGETAEEFAARLRVKPRTLKWWRWFFATERQRRREERARLGGAQFVEVVHAGHERSGAAAAGDIGAAASCGCLAERLEVSLPGGIRIHVPGGFDAAAVGCLVAALERR